MVKIIADSTCDLSDDLIKKYDVDIIFYAISQQKMLYFFRSTDYDKY